MTQLSTQRENIGYLDRNDFLYQTLFEHVLPHENFSPFLLVASITANSGVLNTVDITDGQNITHEYDLEEITGLPSPVIIARMRAVARYGIDNPKHFNLFISQLCEETKLGFVEIGKAIMETVFTTDEPSEIIVIDFLTSIFSSPDDQSVAKEMI